MAGQALQPSKVGNQLSPGDLDFMMHAVAVAKFKNERPASVVKVPCLAQHFIGFANGSCLVRFFYIANELIED